MAMGRAPLRLEEGLLRRVLDRVTDIVLIGQSGLSYASGDADAATVYLLARGR